MQSVFPAHTNSASVITIIDDKVENIQLIATLLRTEGYPISIAQNGSQALDVISQSPQPDLILLDIMMPEMDGFETCRRLKANPQTRDIPVIFLSARTEQVDKTQGFELGAVDYVTKPIEKAELLARIRTHLEIRHYRKHLEREVELRTEQLRVQNLELLESKSFLNSMLNAIPSMIVGVDNANRIQFWNHTAEKETGLSGDIVSGEPLAVILPHAAKQLFHVAEHLRNNSPISVSSMPWMIEDRIDYFDYTFLRLDQPEAQAIQIIKIDNVTERIQLQETLVQSEKMLSIGGLAAGMAHEINNPLNGIACTAQLLKQRLLDDLRKNIDAADQAKIEMAQLRHYLDLRGIPDMLAQIDKAVNRAATVIDNMLHYSRKGEREMRFEEPAKLVNNTLELVELDRKLKRMTSGQILKMDHQVSPNLPKVRCMASDIEQVLFNLIRNAAQALAEHLNQSQPTITVRAFRRGGHIALEVEDNGPGISPEQQERIFEPFFSTKTKGSGTGLGLSVSRFIVQDIHQGYLTVKSTPGKGCCFTLQIPLDQSPETVPKEVSTL